MKKEINTVLKLCEKRKASQATFDKKVEDWVYEKLPKLFGDILIGKWYKHLGINGRIGFLKIHKITKVEIEPSGAFLYLHCRFVFPDKLADIEDYYYGSMCYGDMLPAKTEEVEEAIKLIAEEKQRRTDYHEAIKKLSHHKWKTRTQNK